MRNTFANLLIFAAILAAAGAVPTMAAETVRYDGVAKADGLNQTSWLSDGQFFNSSPDQAASLKLSFIPRGAPDPIAETTVTVQPGETLFIADILDSLSLGGGNVGSLLVEGDVHSWVRTFNRDGDMTFGQSLPQVTGTNQYAPEDVLLFPFSMPLSTSEGFRSNLILTNLGTSAATFTVSSGVLTREYSVPAGVYRQINDLGRDLGASPGWYSCSVRATQAYSAFVSTVDPKTGDPATVEGRLQEIGGGSGQCITNDSCSDDNCVCPDCDTDPFCSDPEQCVDNGHCNPFTEGCVCADCASHPDCLDN